MNTATIMDMMFNTEMIVKDMKGGKEDMTENKRFVVIDDTELYYITDTNDLKTLDDYVKEFSKAEYEFTDEEVLSVAKEEYWQMIYEHSMSAKENVDMLNQLFEENEKLKQKIKELKGELIEYIEQTSSDKSNKKGFVGNGRFA